MIERKKDSNTPLSVRQKHYYEEIEPKLSKDILKMNFGMRANICLVSAGITTLDELTSAIKEKREIPLLGPRLREEIRWRLQIEGII